MKRFALIAALLATTIAVNATPASARLYRRPVARGVARVALPPYRVVRPRVYGPGVRVGVGVGVY